MVPLTVYRPPPPSLNTHSLHSVFDSVMSAADLNSAGRDGYFCEILQKKIARMVANVLNGKYFECDEQATTERKLFSKSLSLTDL